MIHIAICDDDAAEGERIKQKVEQCCSEIKAVYKKYVFNNSKALFYEIQEGTHFDLFLLDIQMPELDGMSLTVEIKKLQPDALIIFVTSYEKYVYESFKVQPYRFIPKKRIEEMLQPAIWDALNQIIRQEDIFYIVENQKGLEKIPIKQIAYIWHMGKYAYIEKMDGNVAKVRKTLKQVYQELPEGDFVWVERGCILNISKIAQIKGENIILVNGASISVNKDRLADLKKLVHQYWVEKEGIKG